MRKLTALMTSTMFALLASSVFAATPSQFKFSEFSTVPIIEVGSTFTAKAMVKNSGTSKASGEVSLFVNGKATATKTVELTAGEIKTVTFDTKLGNSGMYDISIGDTAPYKVKAYKEKIDSAVLILDFDEGSGKVAKDKSGFGNDAKLVNTPKWVDGKYGKGIQTADQGYLELPTTPSLDITGDTLTMACWFKPMDEQDYSDFFTKGDYNVLKMQTPEVVNFFAGGWARAECTADVPADWNKKWHHIAGVSDVGVLRVYIDGKLAATLDAPGSIESTSFPWNIGRNAEAPDGRDTEGVLDDVRLYKEALSEADIVKVMTGK